MENNAPLQSISSWFDQNAPQWAQDSASYIATVWNQGDYGLTYGEIITAVVIVVIALLVRGLFARIIVSSVMRLTAGTKTRFDDALVVFLANPYVQAAFPYYTCVVLFVGAVNSIHGHVPL